MFVSEQFYIGVRDFDINYDLKNEQLLYFLESTAAKHSNIAGFGIKQLDETKLTWVLLNWKVDIINRPKYDDKITVKTWSASIDKLYAYRDFEIYNEENTLIGTATSKWLLMNSETWKIERMDKDSMKSYGTENMTIYPNYKYPKVQTNIDLSNNYSEITISKDMIDINHHVHNTCYYTMAIDALPNEIKEKQFDHFEIIYKKEIRKDDKIYCNYYQNDNNQYIITLFNEEHEINSQIIIDLRKDNE